MLLADRATNYGERPPGLDDERGVALMELIIVTPFWLLMMMSIVDIGQALNCYMFLARAASSGARLGSSISNLSPGSFQQQTTGQRCATTYNANRDNGHVQIQSRVLESISSQRPELKQDYCIVSTFVPGPTTNANPERNTVSIKIEARFQTMFPLFRGLPLNVSATAPYLQASSAMPPVP